ncbi:MAG: hypothetical protein AB2693_33400 [Candidatus Thiodiazotropha sp.]
MIKWKDYFQALYNPQSNTTSLANENSEVNNEYDTGETGVNFNNAISIEEVTRAVRKLKAGKATGVDEIPAEVIQSYSCIYFMYILFNNCFETGMIPSSWHYGIINPIQKP